MISVYTKGILKEYGTNMFHYFDIESSPMKDGIKPLLETNEKIEVGEIYNIQGKIYTASMTSIKGWCVFDEVKDSSVFLGNTEAEALYIEDDLTCPYCKYIVGDSYSISNDDKYFDFECPSCGSIYTYIRDISIHYSSIPVKMNIPIQL